VGNGGDDFLIGGTLDGPSDPIDRFDQMLGILVEWDALRNRSQTRSRMILGGDTDADILTGSSGNYAYYYDYLEDKANDRKNEYAEDIG
jgi:hypothetical protein